MKPLSFESLELIEKITKRLRDLESNYWIDKFQSSIVDRLKSMTEKERGIFFQNLSEHFCLDCGSEKLPCYCRFGMKD